MATVLDLVKHYQHAIEKYPNDEQKVLKSIDKLFNLDVTVQHLQETGVGRTVNALRKEPGDIGHAARALVYKWKLMVAAEESDQEGDHNTDTATYNGHENGRDSDDNAKQNSRNNKYDRYEKTTPNVKNEEREVNGNYSGGKRKHQSSEDDEPDIKKSRNSGNSNNHDDYKRKTAVQVKKEPVSEYESDTDRSHSDESDSDSGSESSREVEVKKIKQEIKQEPTDNHKSYSSKQSSSHKTSAEHKSSGAHKRESSSSKRPHDSDKHSKRHHSSEPNDRHSSEKSSTKEKSHSSHKHKSSKDKEKSDKNSKSERSTSEKDKKQKDDSKSSSKHKSSSDKHKSSNSDNNSEKHKSHEKHSSKSDKHRSSSHPQKSDKEKHKSSSEKEVSDDKHKSKHISSSKEKLSSSSKDRSKDRSSSLKEKTDGTKESHHSHKSEKKPTSSSDTKSKHSDSKHKSEKHDEGGSETKSKHKSSSSSSHKSKSSSSKSKEDVPKKKASSGADSDDGIDCGSGASFAEALGMVSPAKPKKKPVPTKEMSATNSTLSKDLSPASLLAPTAKLAPLPSLEISALPDISPNYKPRPPPKMMPHFTEEEALNSVISSKNQRTKVYSGNKVIGKIPTLYEMCVQILQEHIDALEYTGGVPYDILKPVVDRATPQQLFVLEHFNPYLMEDTDHLWEKFCQKNFRNKQRQEMETWREMYMRCQEEQEHRLKSLTANIRMTQEAKKAPIKQTKMAYVDSVVKPPRNIARKQALHGTAHAATASPAARVAALAAAPNVLRGGARAAPAPAPAPASASSFKPKKAPLMQKALQFMRGRKR